MGAFMNLSVRRVQWAPDDLMKLACKKPKSAMAKKKNISRTATGEKLGRIHLKKQNLDTMGNRRVPALRSAH
jgi:ribosome production factor 2